MSFELIVEDVRVPGSDRSGTGSQRSVDVGINDGFIERIGDLSSTAGERLEGSNLWLLPGFIDLHSHSDYALLEDPCGISKLSQGVTTEVTGNCSIGLAPVPAERRGTMVQGAFSYLGAGPEAARSTFDEYRSALKDGKPHLNVAPLVGHGCLRLSVMDRLDRPAGSEERHRMAELLRETLEQGAIGCSLGLMYQPSIHADREELITLAEVLSEQDKLLAVHMRNEGWRAPEALDEMLAVARKTGVRLQISHLKAVGPPNRGLVERLVEQINRARREGVDVAADIYPYAAGSTSLGSLLPEEPDGERTLHERIERCEPDWEGSYGPGAMPAQSVRLAEVDHPRGDDLEGRTVREFGELWDQPPWEAARKLVREANRDPVVVLHLLSEKDIDTVYKQEWGFVASDGNAINPDSPRFQGTVHPRYYGTFPRFIRKWRKEKKRFSMKEVVNKTSAGPARRLGLNDRGTVAEGKRADLVLLDLERVTDRATYNRPHQLSSGIEAVIVNGSIAWKKGSVAPAGRGQILR